MVGLFLVVQMFITEYCSLCYESIFSLSVLSLVQTHLLHRLEGERQLHSCI